MLLEKTTDFEEIINGELVLVDFFATWCGPCKMLAPVLNEFAEANQNVKVLKVDVDEYNSLAKKYEIFSVPTLMVFKNGEMVKRQAGFMDLESLKEFVFE